MCNPHNIGIQESSGRVPFPLQGLKGIMLVRIDRVMTYKCSFAITGSKLRVNKRILMFCCYLVALKTLRRAGQRAWTLLVHIDLMNELAVFIGSGLRPSIFTVRS